MIAAAGSEFGLEVKIPYDGRIPPKERERGREKAVAHSITWFLEDYSEREPK